MPVATSIDTRGALLVYMLTCGVTGVRDSHRHLPSKNKRMETFFGTRSAGATHLLMAFCMASEIATACVALSQQPNKYKKHKI